MCISGKNSLQITEQGVDRWILWLDWRHCILIDATTLRGMGLLGLGVRRRNIWCLPGEDKDHGMKQEWAGQGKVKLYLSARSISFAFFL